MSAIQQVSGDDQRWILEGVSESPQPILTQTDDAAAKRAFLGMVILSSGGTGACLAAVLLNLDLVSLPAISPFAIFALALAVEQYLTGAQMTKGDTTRRGRPFIAEYYREPFVSRCLSLLGWNSMRARTVTRALRYGPFCRLRILPSRVRNTGGAAPTMRRHRDMWSAATIIVGLAMAVASVRLILFTTVLSSMAAVGALLWKIESRR